MLRMSLRRHSLDARNGHYRPLGLTESVSVVKQLRVTKNYSRSDREAYP